MPPRQRQDRRATMAAMSANHQKPSAWRGLINAISTQGIFDASIALCAALLALAGIGSPDPLGNWLFVAFGAVALCAYILIARMTQDKADDAE